MTQVSASGNRVRYPKKEVDDGENFFYEIPPKEYCILWAGMNAERGNPQFKEAVRRRTWAIPIHRERNKKSGGSLWYVLCGDGNDKR